MILALEKKLNFLMTICYLDPLLALLGGQQSKPHIAQLLEIVLAPVRPGVLASNTVFGVVPCPLLWIVIDHSDWSISKCATSMWVP